MFDDVCAGHVTVISVAEHLFGAWVRVTCFSVVSIFGCFFFWVCVSFLKRGDVHVISRGFCCYARPLSHLFRVAISHLLSQLLLNVARGLVIIFRSDLCVSFTFSI